MKIKSNAAVAALIVAGLSAGAMAFGVYISSIDKEETVSFIDGSNTRRLTHYRKQVQIPKAYGRLITITPAGAGAALWFESETGQVRNVVVPDGSPLLIERKGELEK
jgi:hypothetical protein